MRAQRKGALDSGNAIESSSGYFSFLSGLTVAMERERLRKFAAVTGSRSGSLPTSAVRGDGAGSYFGWMQVGLAEIESGKGYCGSADRPPSVAAGDVIDRR